MLANPIPRKKENRASKISLQDAIVSGTVHTTPEKFENGGFTLEEEEFRNATITGHFEFMFEEISVRKSHDYRNLIFWKSFVSNMFSVLAEK